MSDKEVLSIRNEFDIHYADDDSDDIELFSDAVAMIVEKGKEKITLNVYNDGESLLGTVDSVLKDDSVIFLDINMPVKDGIEVLTEIRCRSEFDTLPVVMFSTSSDKDIIEKCWKKGASLYAVKPISFNELIQTIENVLKIRWEGTKPNLEKFVLTK